MTDVAAFDDEARRLTHGLRAAAERARPRTPMPDFAARVERGERHFAVEVLVAGVIAAVVVTLILALPRAKPALPTPPGHTAPVVSLPTTPSPTAVPDIHSTISAAGPLALYWTSSAPDGSVTLMAQTYSGESAGTLVLPPSSSGYDIAPDGTKMLNGDQIIADSGAVLGTISGQFGQLPIWADDSAHLCGVSASGGATAIGSVIEFDYSGRSRTVATLGPIAIATGGWQVLACSPSADRIVVAQENGQAATLIVLQLSSGRVIARRSIGDASWGVPIASHDGSIVALDTPSGVTIRNTKTWAVLGNVVRWGSQAGFPLIGAAIDFSWDGSRIIIDGGGAGGGFHPEWMVDWATDRTLLTNTGTGGQAVGITGFDDGIPLTTSTGFFLPPGSVSADLGAAYLLEANGTLKKLPG
jgi:hypothetical protein